MLFMNGSMNSEGSGVRVVLISPQEEETKLVMHLQFRVSNNKAKYKALLIKLLAAQSVGATRVIIHLDS